MKRLLFIGFVFFTAFTFSQENNEKEDVKVGVVLSGGGAKGFAHISVLKALEEAGVRVDYIGGTSMGAIIGGLYASGYSASELESLVRNVDFDAILSNKLPRKSKPFYEKEDGEKYALVLPIKKKNVGIPKAMSEGQNVLNVLSELTQNVNHIEDFSKLPIPFVCVATNLETGEEKVFKRGFLPQAMKASGTFPTLLAPVEIDGELYIDGGIVNNFPVDLVKAMGADVIIGVDIQGGLQKKEHLDSAVKIINQIVGFQMYNTLEEKYEAVDYLVQPNLKDFYVTSFDKANEIMKQGDSAAQSRINDFKELAKRQSRINLLPSTTNEFRKFHISRIDITGNKNYTRAYILGKLNLKNEDTTSYKRLTESIDNLSATGNFDIVQYKIDETKDGNVVRFKVKETNVWNYLKLGVHYDDLYKTGVLLNFTSKHLFFKNDILSADLILGDNIRYNVNYFIDNGFYWSFGLRLRFNTFYKNIKISDAAVNRITLDYEDFTNQAYLQTVFSRKFAIGGGIEFKRITASTKTILELNGLTSEDNGRLYFDRSNYFNLLGYIKLDTYDKSYFPKKGLFLDASILYYVASTDYNNNFNPFSQLKADFGFAFSIWDKVTFQILSQAGFTLGDNENKALNFNVGGYGENFINNFIPFYGYDFAELEGKGFLRSGLTLRYEFIKKNYLSFSGNYTRVEDDIFYEGLIFDDTRSGYKASYGLETFLGPVEVHYTWSPDHNEDYWYFNVGFWF